jgi:hypothetical protein
MKTSAEYLVRGKFPAKDFHTTENFVLVSRSDALSENSVLFARRRNPAAGYNLRQTEESYFVKRHL